MAELNKKLQLYNKSGTTESVKLYSTTAELIPGKPYLSLSVNGVGNAYAQLNDVGKPYGTRGRVYRQSDGKTYQICKHNISNDKALVTPGESTFIVPENVYAIEVACCGNSKDYAAFGDFLRAYNGYTDNTPSFWYPSSDGTEGYAANYNATKPGPYGKGDIRTCYIRRVINVYPGLSIKIHVPEGGFVLYRFGEHIVPTKTFQWDRPFLCPDSILSNKFKTFDKSTICKQPSVASFGGWDGNYNNMRDVVNIHNAMDANGYVYYFHLSTAQTVTFNYWAAYDVSDGEGSNMRPLLDDSIALNELGYHTIGKGFFVKRTNTHTLNLQAGLHNIKWQGLRSGAVFGSSSRNLTHNAALTQTRI